MLTIDDFVGDLDGLRPAQEEYDTIRKALDHPLIRHSLSPTTEFDMIEDYLIARQFYVMLLPLKVPFAKNRSAKCPTRSKWWAENGSTFENRLENLTPIQLLMIGSLLSDGKLVFPMNVYPPNVSRRIIEIIGGDYAAFGKPIPMI